MKRLLAAGFVLWAGVASADVHNPPTPSSPGGMPLNASGATLPTAEVDLQILGIPGTAADGTTDDTAVIQAYLSTLPATGATIYLRRASTYRIAGNLTIPANIILDCQQAPGFTRPVGAPVDFGTLGGIQLASTATITMSTGSRIQHCPIFRYGATFPVQTAAAFAGTAITWGGGDATDIWLEDDLIVGFAVCVDASAGGDRFHLINVECDGVDGYKIGPSADTSEIRHVRTWPWATATFSPAPTITRTGTGLLFVGNGLNDDIRVSGYTDFGHAVGIDIKDSGGTCCNIYFDNVWLDNNATTPLKVASLATLTTSFKKLTIISGAVTPLNVTTRVYIADLDISSSAANCVTGGGVVSVGFYHIVAGCTPNFTDSAGPKGVWADTTNSTSKTTGTLVVGGGAGIGGDIYSGAGLHALGCSSGGAGGVGNGIAIEFGCAANVGTIESLQNGVARRELRIEGLPLKFNAARGGRIEFGGSASVPVHLGSAQTTAPALTSCGTGSPTISGTDTAGTVTMGTNATECVITFNAAYTSAPHCVVTWRATRLASQNYTVSTAAITTTQTATSGNLLDYVCIAPSGG